MEYYDGRHTGAQLDEAVEAVHSGKVVLDNTSNTVKDKETKPASSGAVYEAIEEVKTTFNGKMQQMHESIDGKVDKEDGARLITEEEVAAISKNTADIKAMDGKYLAATPSGNPNHNLYTSLGAVWSDAGWELHGVPLTNEEIDVSYICSVPYLHRVQQGAWSSMRSYLNNRFKTNFYSLTVNAYNASSKALNANSIGYGALQLQVVRFQNERNETTYKVFIATPQYMFGSNGNLREIQDYLDVSLCTSFASAFGARTKSLETIWLIGLKASIDFSGTPVLKKECLLYMIQKAAPTTAITIKVHADVWAWASTDAEVIAALDAQQDLITLIA